MQNTVVLNNGYKQIIFFLFAYTAIIDSINGFLMFNYNISISIGQLYRVLTILIMIFFIFRFKLNVDQNKGIIIIYYLIFVQFFYFFIHHSLGGLLNDLTEAMRIVLIISIVEGIKKLNEHKKITLSVIEKVFKCSILLFPLCMIFPWLFGAGYSMYVNDVGYSAFFFASNDLNIVLVIMLVYSIDKMFLNLKIKQRNLYYIISTLFLIVSLLLVGSKSSAFFGGLVVVFYIIKNLSESTSPQKKMKVLITTLSSLIISYYVVSVYFSEEILAAFDRHLYFFNQDFIDNNSFSTFILTGRDNFLDGAINAFQSGNELVRLFFGAGYFTHTSETGQFLNRGATPIEMDVFDVFFSYGLIGSVLIYGYLMKILFNVKHFKAVMKNYSRYYFGFIIIIIYSSLGGHVMFSALSGGYFALICGALIIISRNQKYESLKKVGN